MNASAVAMSPKRARGTASSPPRVANRTRWIDGMLGSRTSCRSSATTPRPAPMKNAVRQVATAETKAPSGRLTTVATETPAVMMEVARMTALSRTRRLAIPAPIDQNPPIAIPSSIRATSSTTRFGASAPSTSDTTSRPVSDHSTIRRSTREVRTVTTGAPIAPISPVATTSSPAVPMLICRSSAIAGSSPIGRNSESTSTNDPSATDHTATQPRRSVIPDRTVRGVSHPGMNTAAALQ